MVDPHAPPAPSAVSVAAPLRVAGFLATAIGAALMGLGSLMEWVSIRDPNDLSGVLDRVYRGIDMREGKATLGAALVLLIGLILLRGISSRPARKAVAVVMIVAALAGLAFAVAALVDTGQRFIAVPAETGVLGIGVLFAVAGAVVGVLGAILDLAWSVAPR